MSIPAKPKGALSLKAGHPFADGMFYRMNIATEDGLTAPTGIDRERGEGGYVTRGAVTLVNDAYGTGLSKASGGTDDFIMLSMAGFTHENAFSVPFTRVFVVKPHASNVVLYHSGIRTSGDYNYSSGRQQINLLGTALTWASSNLKGILDVDCAAQMFANEPNVFALSWDGSRAAMACNGVVLGSITSPTTFTRDAQYDMVGLGSGANGDTRDGATFYWYGQFTRALNDTDLASITANPYQMVDSVAVDTTNPLANGLVFAGVPKGGRLRDATGKTEVININNEATTNAFGEAVVFGNSKVYELSPRAVFNGRMSGQPSGMTYMFVGNIAKGGQPNGNVFCDYGGAYSLLVDGNGLLYSNEPLNTPISKTDNIDVSGNVVLIWTQGDQNDPDARLYVNGTKVLQKNSMDGWYMHNFWGVGNSVQYPGADFITGSGNRAFVWNRKMSEADALALSANYDAFIVGAAAPADVMPPEVNSIFAGNDVDFDSGIKYGYIKIQMDEEIADVSAIMANSVFTVSNHTVEAKTMYPDLSVLLPNGKRASKIVFTVAEPFVYGETITVSYLGSTEVAANRVKDTAGNFLQDFADYPTVNNAPAATPVRYIRDTLYGGNAQWVEVGVYDDVETEVGDGKAVTANFAPSAGTLSMVNDSDWDNAVVAPAGLQEATIVIDLGQVINNVSQIYFNHVPNSGDPETSWLRKKVEISTDGVNWTVVFDSVPETAFTDFGGFGVEAPFVAVPTTPSAPVITTITPFSSYLSVSYNPSTSAGGGAIDYYDWEVTPATGQSYTGLTNPKNISSLANGTEYTIRMRAHNQYGFGDWSNSVQATPTSVADTTPPTLVSAVASNTGANGTPGIVMTFSETLSDSQTAEWFNFTVGGTVAKSTFQALIKDSVNKKLILPTAESFLPQHTILLSYAKDNDVAKRIIDNAGNELASFTDFLVTNGQAPATESVKPFPVSARASNVVRNGTPGLEITFSEKMYETVNPTRFALSGHTLGNASLMTNASGVGVYRLQIMEPITAGEVLKVTYTPVNGSNANLFDLNGNLADAFANFAVTNEVPDGTAPVVVSIVLDNTAYNGGPGFIVTFNEQINDTDTTDLGDWAVTGRIGDIKGYIKDGVNKRRIVGVYSSYIVGTTPTIAYNKPADGVRGIKDMSGNLLNSLSMTPTNNMVAGSDTVKPTVASLRVNNTLFQGGPGLEVVMSERTYERVLITSRFVVSNNAFTGNTQTSLENGVTVYRLGMNNPITFGQAVTATYNKSTEGPSFNIRDLYGNEVDAFTNRAATNDVPDNAVPVLMSAVLENGTNPGVVLTFDKDMNKDVLPAASAFTITGKTVAAVSQQLANPKAIKVRISTTFAYTDVVNISYSKPATNPLKSVGATEVPSFGPVAVTNPLESPTKPTLPGYLLKTYGDGPEYDFQNENDLNNYINGFNCITQATKLMIWFYKNINIGGRQIGPANSDEQYYVTWRPAPGLSYLELEAADAPAQYGTVGLEILAPTEGGFRIGTRVEGFRFKVSGTSQYQALFMRRNGWDHGGNVGDFVQCRFLLQTVSTGIGTGEYGGWACFYDCLFIQDAVTDKPIVSHSSGSIMQRNTFVKINGATGAAVFRGTQADDNLFINCGGDPMGDVPGQKNVTDTPLSTPRASMTYGAAPLIVSSTNYRPKAGTAAIGTASYMAVSKNDNKGNNRGLAPDVGAFQLVPAMPLPEGKVTSQVVDGQSLKVQLTTTKLPASGTITLVPSNDPKGAIGVGPVPIVIGNGVASVELDDVPPGNYNAPIVMLSNEGGSFPATGTSPFQLMGMGNLAYDTEAPAPATAVTISAPNVAVVNVATDNISVGLNGTSNVTVKVTPSDNGAGGIFTPASVNIVNGAPAFFTYKRSSAGTSQISVTNDGGLINPTPATIVVSNPAQNVPPTISITSIDQSILSGRNAKANGTYDFKGDAGGKVEIFLDRVASTEVLGPYPATVLNGTWNLLQTVPAGVYKLRAVATAHALTATATSGNVTMRGLTGRPKLPKQ
jgi:hypothetical protein